MSGAILSSRNHWNNSAAPAYRASLNIESGDWSEIASPKNSAPIAFPKMFCWPAVISVYVWSMMRPFCSMASANPNK